MILRIRTVSQEHLLLYYIISEQFVLRTFSSTKGLDNPAQVLSLAKKSSVVAYIQHGERHWLRAIVRFVCQRMHIELLFLLVDLQSLLL